jgi:hypothetical protein
MKMLMGGEAMEVELLTEEAQLAATRALMQKSGIEIQVFAGQVAVFEVDSVVKRPPTTEGPDSQWRYFANLRKVSDMQR